MKSCEDVYIKVGSCESVSVKAEPSFSDVSVKVEGLLDDVCVEDESVAVRAAAAELYADHIVKTEPCEDGYINLGSPCESVSVKTEPSFSDVSVNVGVSATAQLYIDHVVKDELVLGQEIVERRAPTTSKLATEVNQSLVRIVPGQQPMLKDCFVRLEHIFDDELLTVTRCIEDRDSTREEADVKRAYRNTAFSEVGKVEEYNGASKLATEVNQSLVRIVPSQQPMLRDCFVRLEHIFDDELLTVTRCTEDRDSTREDVKRAYRNTAFSEVGKVEEYNGVSKLATEVNQSLVRIVPSQQPMLKDCFVRLERIFDDDLLTLTRCTEDRDSTREEADVKRAYRITAVRKVEEYNGGQTTQKKPTGRSMTYHYQCAHCRYKTGTKLYLITHLSNARNHSLEKIYRCNICAYVAVSKSDLRRHVTIHTGDKPFKCGHCSYATCHKNGLVKHTLIHTGGKPYKCVQCSYVTGYRCNLKKHIRSHSGEKPYKCDQCSFASGYITSLLNHKRLHTGDKPFKCDQCSYTCFRKIYLRKHIMKHTGDKPYKCVQCGYASVCKSNLQNHIKTHTGDKPYKCDQCSYASCRNDSLKRHIKIHSGV